MPYSNFVIKCGGSTLAALPDTFYEEMKHLQDEGHIPVVVHGGGPAISQMLDRLEIETEFVNGLRKTDETVLDVVEMILCGKMNKDIVRRIQQAGGKAVGICGEDGQMIQARAVVNMGDIGFVGEVEKVDGTLAQGLIEMGYIPVIAPLGVDSRMQRYNINADTAAGAVASFIGAERLIAVTDVPGIIRKTGGKEVVLPTVTVDEVEAMIESGVIYGGMIPKVRAAVQCIQGNMEEVVIVHGGEPDVLSRVLRGEQVGTRIVR